LLWGIDELLTYHYLVAEALRWLDIPFETFWSLGKRQQADLVWQTLFVERPPISESCRGLLTSLQKLGLDAASRDLADHRAYFDRLDVEEHIARVFNLVGIDCAVMTNDPFDDQERPGWLSGVKPDSRFRAALRLDALLLGFGAAAPKLRSMGFNVADDLGGSSRAEVRRFLSEWIDRMGALYMAVSLPPTFVFPEASTLGRLIADCVLPVAAEKHIPTALMIGVKRAVNPALRLAGDGVGRADLQAVENLCRSFPANRFLVTVLSRENQHELCVIARKFRNLMVFGCWWFVNNPSLIDEITRMRVELLGGSFIPQHSDARVLEQVIYKWAHSRQIIGEVLAEKYADLAATGWNVSEKEIKEDVARLFGGNFWSFAQARIA
jgi:hypothetical protein